MKSQTAALKKLFALLAAGVIALLLSSWLLFDFSAQLADLSERQTTATEYALTLTRLANKVDGSQPGASAVALNDDSVARLIAMGDVQTAELTRSTGSGLLKRLEITNLHAGGEPLAQQWSVIRNQISALNTETIIGADRVRQPAMNTAFIKTLNESFDAAFIAITNETLSIPLLRSVSAIKAELSNLLFLSGLSSSTELNNTTNATLGVLLQSVSGLQKQSFSEQGVSLLGYESNILLQNFVEQVSELRPVKSATVVPSQGSTPQEGKIDTLAVQDQIIVALDQNSVYRRALDGAIYQNRRSILGALALVCAALLLSALITWRLLRLKAMPAALPQASLSPMIADISALADGDLTAEVRSLEGDSAHAVQSREIAQAVNYTGKMLHSLVEVSRGVANKTHTLSVQQQQIAEDLIKANIERHKQITSLLEGLNQRRIELQTLGDDESLSGDNFSATAVECSRLAKDATAALAGISAEVELGASRVSRVVETVSELATMVDKIKSMAEKSSLHALNTSIQMSAYSDGGDSDVSPQFVDQVQRFSRQLEAGASDAGRLLEIIKTDLHVSSTSMANCASAIDDSADHSMNASRSMSAVVSSVENIGETNKFLIDALKKEADNLSDVVENLCQLHDSTIERNHLPGLVDSTIDFQSMAGNLDKSLSRYKLSTEQTVDG